MCYTAHIMDDIPRFADLGIPESLCARLEQTGITAPTAVQQAVIPLLQTHRHLLFRSETGTGKTFAYALPLLARIGADDRSVRVIIAAPSYELASQIRTEIQRVSAAPSALCIGNTSITRQIETLKRKPNIVVGNPARLLELIQLKKLKTQNVSAVVLDEADQLFSKEIRSITAELVSRMPPSVQLAACSATAADSLLGMLSRALPSGSPDAEICTCFMPEENILRSRITHYAVFSEQRNKLDTLRKLFHALNPAKTLIFTARPADVEKCASFLASKKIPCAPLYAKADKTARKQAIDGFRRGTYQILVASDLSARGIDVLDITHVIQMDVPEHTAAFVHRAGRTARAGRSGVNVVIGNERELVRLSSFEKKLKIVIYPRILWKGKLIAPSAAETGAPFDA